MQLLAWGEGCMLGRTPCPKEPAALGRVPLSASWEEDLVGPFFSNEALLISFVCFIFLVIDFYLICRFSVWMAK